MAAEQHLAYAKRSLLDKLKAHGLPGDDGPIEGPPSLMEFCAHPISVLDGIPPEIVEAHIKIPRVLQQAPGWEPIPRQEFRANGIPTHLALHEIQAQIDQLTDEIATCVYGSIPKDVKRIHVMGNIMTVWEKHLIEFRIYYYQ
jgi:hypothetical protein